MVTYSVEYLPHVMYESTVSWKIKEDRIIMALLEGLKRVDSLGLLVCGGLVFRGLY